MLGLREAWSLSVSLLPLVQPRVVLTPSKVRDGTPSMPTGTENGNATHTNMSTLVSESSGRMARITP